VVLKSGGARLAWSRGNPERGSKAQNGQLKEVSLEYLREEVQGLVHGSHGRFVSQELLATPDVLCSRSAVSYQGIAFCYLPMGILWTAILLHHRLVRFDGKSFG